MTSSCSPAACFSLMSSSLSMAIDASAESRVCPVAQLRKIAWNVTFHSKRSPWKRQTKDRIARWCEGGGHSSSLSTLTTCQRENFADDITGGQRQAYCWALGALHIKIWLADDTRQSNGLSNGRSQLQRKASNTSSAGPWSEKKKIYTLFTFWRPTTEQKKG